MIRYPARRPVLLAVALALPAVGLVGGVTPATAATTAFTSTTPTPIGGSSQAVAGAGGVVIYDGKASSYPVTTATYVDGLVGTVTDVNLRIDNFSHERPDDVDIMLVSPTGKKSVVMSDIAAGGTPSSDIDLVLDEEAPQSLPLVGGLQSASYRPVNYYDGVSDTFPAPVPTGTVHSGLSAFDGIDPTGVWSLFVHDDQFDYFGKITDWSLELSTTGTTAYPSTITVAGPSTSVTDVDVTLTGLDHPNLGEVDMLLVGPAGQQATIFSDALGSGPQASIGLDDEAATPYRTPKEPSTFQPTNEGSTPDVFPAPAPEASGSAQLSVFDGTDPNGEWRLFVVDDTDGVRGSLAGWSLRITTADAPAPGTPTTDPAPTPNAGGTVDTRHPRVSATNPGKAATGVRRGADVVATLDEAVRRATVTGSSAYLVRMGTNHHVRASVTWQPTTKRIVIDPSRRLRAGSSYRAVITTAVQDRAGNRLDQDPTKPGLQSKTWRFTTR